ncbi:LCP family protein required for cell wall assembly [Hamadaea flava]|uniref:LCP family protein n=1 Tax=Hamadaea flava TaxID=1742688 RepID=A0ABV8LUU9_9ACTN|nr:LCP family protein [Hamadaea flava]MCP2327371.1 LCP family protein required for cell wall assembly [Hamadaea flava]
MSIPSDADPSIDPQEIAHGGDNVEDSDSQVAPPSAAPAPKRRRWLRVTLWSLVTLALVAAGSVVGLRLYLKSVENKVTRVDAFAEVVESERPAKPVQTTKAVNLLILGSDSRDPDTDGSRTDTIMLAHVAADRSSAQIVSIPRDTWLDIPRAKNGHGGVKAKINAAFAWGGIPLMVRTVEAYSKVRIDHVVVIDFAGFAQVVDALGGIEVDVEKNFTSIHPPYRKFKAGPQHLDGAEALDYSRQRKQFANGDFSRIKHQQQVIRAVLAKATSAGILTDPVKLNNFLKATAGAISADKGFDLFGTAMELRGMNTSRIRFITNPTSGGGWEGTQSVVYANKAVAASLFEAINNDTAATWQAPKS